MAIKEPPKKLSRHQKDYPRYKTIWQYERAFKRAYTKNLGEAMEEVLREINKMLKKQ